nr:hypothetical protein [Alicyclobacillus sp. SO9]
MSDKSQLDRIEDLLAQLISNVADVRAKTDSIDNKLEDFRREANERLDRVEGQLAVVNQRLDHQRTRLAKAEKTSICFKQMNINKTIVPIFRAADTQFLLFPRIFTFSRTHYSSSLLGHIMLSRTPKASAISSDVSLFRRLT